MKALYMFNGYTVEIPYKDKLNKLFKTEFSEIIHLLNLLTKGEINNEYKTSKHESISKILKEGEIKLIKQPEGIHYNNNKYLVIYGDFVTENNITTIIKVKEMLFMKKSGIVDRAKMYSKIYDSEYIIPEIHTNPIIFKY